MSKLFLLFLQRVADGGSATEKVKAEWTSEGERKFFRKIAGEQAFSGGRDDGGGAEIASGGRRQRLRAIVTTAAAAQSGG